MGMLEARERQPEVVEPLIEGLTHDRDAKRPHVGKVRQAHPPRRVLWWKITSRLGPLIARHWAMRRSKVRRIPGANPRSRGQTSSKMATARMPGAASSIGTIALSHTPASGSGRRRPWGFFFCDGNRGSASIR
jgi:hypothetical protein